MVFFHYEISVMVGFVLLRDFNDGRFYSVMRFQWRPVLFGYKISKTVGFVAVFFYEISRKVGFVCLRDLNDGRFSVSYGFFSLQDFNDSRFCFFVLLRDFKESRFCSVTRFLWWSVLLKSVTRFQWSSVLFSYDISMTVGFVPLFCYEISRKVGFVLLQDSYDGRICSVMRFQWWTVLFGYEISMMVGFQCQMGFFHYEISVIVSFVLLWDFNDGWFYSVMRSQWW